MTAETITNSIEDLIFSLSKNPCIDKAQTFNAIKYLIVKLKDDHIDEAQDPEFTDKTIMDLLCHLLKLIEIERDHDDSDPKAVFTDMFHAIHLLRSKNCFNIHVNTH